MATMSLGLSVARQGAATTGSSPGMGRFLGQDQAPVPPRRPQTLNGYTYVGNNPVNSVDPSGLWCPRNPEDCIPRLDLVDLFLHKVFKEALVAEFSVEHHRFMTKELSDISKLSSMLPISGGECLLDGGGGVDDKVKGQGPVSIGYSKGQGLQSLGLAILQYSHILRLGGLQ